MLYDFFMVRARAQCSLCPVGPLAFHRGQVKRGPVDSFRRTNAGFIFRGLRMYTCLRGSLSCCFIKSVFLMVF